MVWEKLKNGCFCRAVFQEPDCSSVDIDRASGKCIGAHTPTAKCSVALTQSCLAQKAAGESECLACVHHAPTSAKLLAAGCTTNSAEGWCGKTPHGGKTALPQFEHSSVSGTVRNLFNLTGAEIHEYMFGP
jgi:hypothetical protein